MTNRVELQHDGMPALPIGRREKRGTHIQGTRGRFAPGRPRPWRVLRGGGQCAQLGVRVLVSLVDITTGADLWAGRVDGDLTDVLASQDQITASVIAAIGPCLFNAEIKRARGEAVPRKRAYDLMLRALALCHSRTRTDLEEAESLLRHSR